MKRKYHLPHIRALLVAGFSIEELRALCYDYFLPVYNQTTDATGKQELVTRLLEYAEATIQMDTLLALAEEANPAQYDEHKPYYAERPQEAEDMFPDKSRPIWAWVVGSVLVLSLLVSGSLWGIRAIRGLRVAPTATPTAMPVPAATSTVTPAPMATSTAIPEPTPTHTLKATNTKTSTPTPTHTPTSTGTSTPTQTPTSTGTPTPTHTPTPGLVQRRAVDYDATMRGEGDANHHEWVPATIDPVLGCPGEDTFAIKAISLTPPALKGSNDARNERKGPAVIYEFELLPATYYLYVRGFAQTTDQDAVFVSWKAPGEVLPLPTPLDTEKGLKFEILKPPKLNWQPGEDQYQGQGLIEVEVEAEGKYAFIFRMRKVGLVLKAIVLSPRKCDFDDSPCNVEKACGVSD